VWGGVVWVPAEPVGSGEDVGGRQGVPILSGEEATFPCTPIQDLGGCLR
jgi:hypothetical protein